MPLIEVDECQLALCVGHEYYWYEHGASQKSACSSSPRTPEKGLYPAELRRIEAEISHRGQKLRDTQASSKERWAAVLALEFVVRTCDCTIIQTVVQFEQNGRGEGHADLAEGVKYYQNSVGYNPPYEFR